MKHAIWAMAVAGATLALTIGTARAATATVGGVEWNYTTVSGGVRLDGIKTSLLSSNELTTPTRIDGKTVTEIGDECFNGRDTLTAITIAEGVVTMGHYPFSGCSRLKTVSLPSTLKSIADIFGRQIHPATILFPKGSSYFAISGGFLYSKTAKTLHCLLDVEAAVVPSGVTAIPDYIGQQTEDVGICSLVVCEGVTSIGDYAFCGYFDSMDCYFSSLQSLSLPETLREIGDYAFCGCECSHVVIPSAVTSIEKYAFSHGEINTVEFMGGSAVLGSRAFYECGRDYIFHAQAPANLSAAYVVEDASSVTYPKEYAAQYATAFDEYQFVGYTNPDTCSVVVKSAKMRSNDPTVMDITFRVTSSKPTVKVRALAFTNDTHSLRYAVRIKSYSDSFGSAIGDAVTANVDHTFAWKVSDDITNKVATLAIEVLAVTESPLPFEFVTIPASGSQSELTIARNRITQSRWDDAMLWVFADKNAKWTKVVESRDADTGEYRYSAIDDRGTIIYSNASLDGLWFKILGYDAATEDQIEYARTKTGYSFPQYYLELWYNRYWDCGWGCYYGGATMHYAVKK